MDEMKACAMGLSQRNLFGSSYPVSRLLSGLTKGQRDGTTRQSANLLSLNFAPMQNAWENLIIFVLRVAFSKLTSEMRSSECKNILTLAQGQC